MFTVALLALAVAGCTTTSTPTAHPTDTTPGSLPTQTAPTATPAPTSWLSGYSQEPNTGMHQQTMFDQMVCKFLYYHNSDWTLPHALQTMYGNAHHGVIYMLELSNPTGSQQTITAGDDIKSTIQYFSAGSRGYMPTSEVFYDPATKAEYGTITIANGETRDVYMLAYITNDSAYDAYSSAIDTVSLDLNPHYQPY